MGSREDARRAWRARVARADRALCAAIAESRNIPATDEDAAEAAKYRFYDAWEAFDLAIAAPKPWAKPRAGADLGKWRCVMEGLSGVRCRHHRTRRRKRT